MSWPGDKLVISAQNELIAAQARGRSASNEAISIANDSIRSLQYQLRRAKDDADEAEMALAKEVKKNKDIKVQNEKLQRESQELKDAIAERDAIICEWMVSNEAFRRLAREYGTKIGLTDEQRQMAVDNHILNISEEDANFQKTKRYERARQRLGK